MLQLHFCCVLLTLYYYVVFKKKNNNSFVHISLKVFLPTNVFAWPMACHGEAG